MLRSLLLSMVMIPALPAATATDIPPIAHPEIVKVDCAVGSGTAFRVGPTTLLSVNHVTALGGCAIDGEPIRVVESVGDFSILASLHRAERWLRIDCSGFAKDRSYVAIGYARGLPFQTSVETVATGNKINGIALLWGVFTFVPGQSGGPVIDPITNRVVGTVNSYNAQSGISGSTPLSDTPVCAA